MNNGVGGCAEEDIFHLYKRDEVIYSRRNDVSWDAPKRRNAVECEFQKERLSARYRVMDMGGRVLPRVE